MMSAVRCAMLLAVLAVGAEANAKYKDTPNTLTVTTPDTKQVLSGKGEELTVRQGRRWHVRDVPRRARDSRMHATPQTPVHVCTQYIKAAGGKDDFVKIHVTTTEATDSFKTVTLRLCYAPESQKDRKWRKTKDNFKKNNQCKQPGLAKIKTMDWPAGQKEVSYDFKPDENVAEASYFVEAYVQDADSKYVAWGSSKASSHFYIFAWEAIDAGLQTACIILSCISWASLGGYWAKDMIFKQSQ